MLDFSSLEASQSGAKTERRDKKDECVHDGQKKKSKDRFSLDISTVLE